MEKNNQVLNKTYLNNLKKNIEDNMFDKNLFFTTNTECKKVLQAIEQIVIDIPEITVTKFFIGTIIPIMYSPNLNNSIRDNLVDITFKFVLSNKVKLIILADKDQFNFISSIKDVYSSLLNTLYQNDYNNWHRLWILFYRICKDKIHYYTAVTNSLLKILIYAFKRKSDECRLKALDCWIALINNAGLNKNYIRNPKRIELFLKPLRESQLQPNNILMLKRLEVFICILTNLKENAILCLENFLKFCFAPFDVNEENIVGQAKMFHKFCMKTSAVLCEIIGHRHEKQKCRDLKILKLKVPMVNNTNFSKYYTIIIRSVYKCTRVLQMLEVGPSRNIVIQCIWTSLFYLIYESNDDIKKICFMYIDDVLIDMQKRMNGEEPNDNMISLIKVILIKPTGHLQDITFRCLMEILAVVPIKNWMPDKKDLEEFLSSYITIENEKQIATNILDYFNYEKYYINVKLRSNIWLKFASTNVPFEFSLNFLKFLIWPFLNLAAYMKPRKVFHLMWTKLYVEKCNTEERKVQLINELEHLNDKEINVNFLLIIKWITTSNVSKDMGTKLMHLSCNIFKNRDVSTAFIKSYFRIIFTFLNKHLDYFTDNELIVNNMCEFLGYGLVTYKLHYILKQLETFLKKLSNNILQQFSKYMFSILKDLIINHLKSREDITTAHIIGQLLGFNKNSLSLNSETVSYNFRLFDHIRRSSVIINTPPRVRNVRRNTIHDFVPIETKIVFDPLKLTDHQNEIWKKRNDNIPALYEDLTQSLSHDLSVDNLDDSNNIDVNQSKCEDSDKNALKNSSRSGRRKSLTTNQTIMENIEQSKRNNQLTLENSSTSTNPNKNSGRKNDKYNKVQMELRKIKMDIVNGGFIKTLPSKRIRKNAKNKCDDIIMAVNKSKFEDNMTSQSVKNSETNHCEFSKSLDSQDIVEGSQENKISFSKPPLSNKNSNICDELKKSESIGSANDSNKLKNCKVLMDIGSSKCGVKTSSPKKLATSKSENEIKMLTTNNINYLKDAEEMLGLRSDISTPKMLENKDTKKELSNVVTEGHIESCDKHNIVTLDVKKSEMNAMDTETFINPVAASVSEDVQNSILQLNKSNQMTELEQQTNINTDKSENEISMISTTTFQNLRHVEEQQMKANVLTEGNEYLVSSPVTCHTPERNSELLSNTIDISPIDTEKVPSLNQCSTSEIINERKNVEKQNKKKSFSLSTPPSIRKTSVLSPSVNRIKQMMNKCRDNKVQNTTDRQNIEEEEEYKETDLLTFSKEVPSPLTVPRNSILKRKLDSEDRGLSPCPKRKRVNFSYPTTSCKKIYLKDVEEYNHLLSENENGKVSCYQNIFQDNTRDKVEEKSDISNIINANSDSLNIMKITEENIALDKLVLGCHKTIKDALEELSTIDRNYVLIGITKCLIDEFKLP